jgi:hypothetical protein
MTPALAAAIASWLARPRRAAADDTRTTLPPPGCAASTRPAARTVANAVVRLSAIVRANSSAVVRCAGLSSSEPTQFTSPAIGPWRAATSATPWSTASNCVASRTMVSTAPSPSEAASASSFAASRAASTTRAPLAVSRCASALPMPPVAPRMRCRGVSVSVTPS